MKKTHYIGTFKSLDGHFYQLDAYCFGFIEAVILLTAKAIQNGHTYTQLSFIVDEYNKKKYVDKLLKISSILSDTQNFE